MRGDVLQRLIFDFKFKVYLLQLGLNFLLIFISIEINCLYELRMLSYGTCRTCTILLMQEKGHHKTRSRSMAQMCNEYGEFQKLGFSPFQHEEMFRFNEINFVFVRP